MLYSFPQGYTDILRRQFGTKRVRANVIYQEYIKEKDHIHMNSTRWMSLTGFVQYLGRIGIAKIDQNEKGCALGSGLELMTSVRKWAGSRPGRPGRLGRPVKNGCRESLPAYPGRLL